MMLFRRKKRGVPSEVRPIRHLAVIMDGNGRWAKRRGLPRKAGHRAGATNLRRLARLCVEHKIDYLTVYAFSTENWKRPKAEVDALMKLFLEFLDRYEAEMKKEGIRLRLLGDITGLPDEVARAFAEAEERSKDRKTLQLILAVNYGGTAEIVSAVKKIADDVESGLIGPDSITEETVRGALYLPDVPDPDLIIRPSGEMRLSNFLTFQSAYAELWFSDVLWPDFSEKDFLRALESFSARDRRFGGLGDGTSS